MRALRAIHLRKTRIDHALETATSSELFKAPDAPAAAMNLSGEYTCPMHPKVRQKGPGSCPICGMALEPVVASATNGDSPELRDMSRRFWMGLALTAPVFALAMGAHLVNLGNLVALQKSNEVQLLLATPVVWWAGWPFFERAWKSIVNHSPNMFTLVALGTTMAWTYSIVGTSVPWLFPAAFRTDGGAVPVYFEAAAMTTVLVLLGQVIELRARQKTSGAIRGLLQLAPKTVVRLTQGGADETVSIDTLKVGDLVRVKPGERIPVDGTLTEGNGVVDASMLTGEPMPVMKSPGAKVSAGTLNQTGSFVMRAAKVGADTLLAQMVEMVSAAQRSRAPIQRVADQVSAWFVPAVIGIAAITFAVWLFWGPSPTFSYALITSVAVLIIACPCALGLATPMSIMVGIGRGAQNGVLIRDAAALERMETIDTLVVDKTGTLTEGHPKVVEVATSPGFDAAQWLAKVASLERASEHPLAAAIVAEALVKKLPLTAATDFRSTLGKGVCGSVEGVCVHCGSDKFLSENHIDVAPLKVAAQKWQAMSATVIFVALGGKLAGFVAITDPIKATTRSALEALRQDGVRIVMLTGDSMTTARAVGRDLGIAEVMAQVLPADKAAVVQQLKKEGRVVAMAGDGVNDAPALATANVGIAMDTGTDIAMENSGITLLHGDLMGIVRARKLSQHTMRNIRQNLILSFAYNVVGIAIAAGVLYPFTGMLLSPAVAAAAMALSSVSVIANALRLRNSKLDA